MSSFFFVEKYGPNLIESNNLYRVTKKSNLLLSRDIKPISDCLIVHSYQLHLGCHDQTG